MSGADSEEKLLAKARDAAYRYLAYRPRSRAEIEQKLQDKEFNETIVERILTDLERLGYINDRQFAGQWARSRVRLRGFGRRRIERELRDKGVDQDIIKETLAEVFADEGEIETARQVAAKKLATMKAVDHQTRKRRLAGFLEQKGFPYDVIWTVLKETDGPTADRSSNM